MNSFRRNFIGIVTLSAIFAGCIPEKRIVWSPDGRRAAVTSAAGLFIIDDQGKVLKPRLTGTAARCDWFADGRQLAVIHTKMAERWEDMAPIFSPAETDAIKKRAESLREQILAYEGDWDKFDLDPDKKLSIDVELGALIYMRDHHSEGLAEKVGKQWTDIQTMKNAIWTLQLFTLKDDALEPGAVLLRTLAELRQPCVDPKGRNIAFLRTGSDQGQDVVSLSVVSTEAGPARHVASNVAIDYDWSPDGRSLAFIQAAGVDDEDADQIQLGSLTTITVAGSDGKLLPEWSQREQRVGLLFNAALGVDWLKDGRLMFSSVEVKLPATSRDMPREWSLFMLDPRMPASVARVLGRDLDGSLDLTLPLFELSPDETRVLLPGPKGRLSLYEFASGETTQLVSQDDSEGKTRSIATWRGNDEVCYVNQLANGQDKPTPVVVLRKGKDERRLDADWPAEMKEGWLSKN